MDPKRERLSALEEKHLVDAFLADRDERTFRKLYRYATPVLYQMTLRLVGWVEQDAEEVVQDAWIRAVERMQQFRWESSFQSWICGIAINRCRELFRQRVKQRSEIQATAEQLEEIGVAQTNSESVDLEGAIAGLPDGYRAVLTLHDIEGYTHEEISEMLDIEIGTSKSQLSRARNAVRQALGRG